VTRCASLPAVAADLDIPEQRLAELDGGALTHDLAAGGPWDTDTSERTKATTTLCH
jgi:hypothetical protein